MPRCSCLQTLVFSYSNYWNMEFAKLNFLDYARFAFNYSIILSSTVICGPGSSSGKALGYGLDGPGSILGVGGGGDFYSLVRVQTGPAVHSASYKMSTGGFPLGVKAAECRTSHPTSS